MLTNLNNDTIATFETIRTDDAPVASNETIVTFDTTDLRQHDSDTLAQKSDAEAAPTASPDENMPQRSKARITLIMIALCLSLFLSAIDFTITTTPLPTITQHFNSSAGYTWIGSAYLLSTAASTLLWGKISDIWGRRPIFLLAIVFFSVGSLLCALSRSMTMLIAARAIQGTGGGGIIILTNICIGDVFSMRNRGMFYGLSNLVWAVAGGIGPVMGGVFTEKLSWRWCFYINLPFAGLAFAVIFFFLDLQTPHTPLLIGLKAIDWLGGITIIGATITFLIGLEFGGVTFPWNSTQVICLIVFGLTMVVLFWFFEAKFARYPVMPLRLFKHRSNIAALCVCFSHALTYISASYYLPLYFQSVLGATPLKSGIYLLPFAISIAVSSTCTGFFTRKTGRYLEPIQFGMTFLTLGFGLFINLDASSGWAKIIIYQIIAGVGAGANIQSPLIALQTLTPAQDNATATSTFGFVRGLALAISIVLGGVVFQNGMESQAGELRAQLGDSVAALLSGSKAGANIIVIDSLGPVQQKVARLAFAWALKRMWILYTCTAAAGLVASFFVGRQELSRVHEEVRTGLQESSTTALMEKQQ